MNDIIVFESEKKSGLEERIRSQASLAYASPLCSLDTLPTALSSDVTSSCQKALNEFVARAGRDDEDVYHTFSILVTTSWNKNDDVFSKEEVWASKNTPKYKPANIEHDEKKIVGGIVGSWPVDASFGLIPEEVSADSLPDPFHILVSSVIYRQWQDPEYRSRAEDLIEKIESGEMFVSMECVFRGFDYAVVTPDGSNHMIPRNAETAFLTSHLRAYGGEGSYQDHKVGRLLKNITFSGKGFVQRPANPDSIIFDKKHIFDFANVSMAKNLFSTGDGVKIKVENEIFSNSNIQENSDMSNEILSDQIDELKEALASAKAENKALLEKLSKANVEKLESQIGELTQSVETLNEDLTQAKEDLSASNSKAEELEAQVAEEVEAKIKAEGQLQTLERERMTAARVATLVEAGLSEEDALSKVEVFESLTDDQFEAIAETLRDSRTHTEDKAQEEAEAEEEGEEVDADEAKTEEDTEDHEEASEAGEEVLETASPEEAIDMSAASEDSEEEAGHVRSNLRDWVNTYVLNIDSESGE